eukprot:9161702-Alexandrium_andersonii.AAC.1
MSASLVGSEMCIRDRLWRCMEAACISGGVWWHLSHNWPCLGPCPARFRDCLLYTSDAADDM